MLLGPDTTGQFKRVQVKGIHTKAVAVDEVRAGQSASFAVKVVGGHNKEDRQLKRAHVRKGMVLLDPELKPRATRAFAAEVKLQEAKGADCGKPWAYTMKTCPTDAVAQMAVLDEVYERAGKKLLSRFCAHY